MHNQIFIIFFNFNGRNFYDIFNVTSVLFDVLHIVYTKYAGRRHTTIFNANVLDNALLSSKIITRSHQEAQRKIIILISMRRFI